MRSGLGLTIILATAVASGAQAGSPSRFDLACEGTTSHVDAAVGQAYVVDSGPATMRLSIDLKARRWCYQDSGCRTAFPVASLRGATLTLMAVKTELNEVDFTVDRVTGAYSRRIVTPQYPAPLTSTGTCASAPFTPIG